MAIYSSLKAPLRSLILVLFLSCSIILTYAQTPPVFSYQLKVNDFSGNPIGNALISLELSIIQGSETGTVVYTEEHEQTSTADGLLNIVVGNGDTSNDFEAIRWQDLSMYLKVRLDIEGNSNYSDYSIEKIQSVPYAFHAGQAILDNVIDGDHNPENELNQDLILENSELQIMDGGGTLQVDLSELIDRGVDQDASNELNTSMQLNNTILEVSDAGGTRSIDLNALQDGTIDGDASPTNELQSLYKNEDTIFLSNGGWVIDQANNYTAGNGITIENNVISSSTDCSYAVGDTIMDGIVIFLEPNGCHGLLMYPEIFGPVAWDNSSTPGYTCANGRGLYAGAMNNKLIVTNLGEGDYAAYRCDTLTSATSARWHMPNSYEFELLWHYFTYIDNSNYPTGLIWTSEEVTNDTSKAYAFYMNSHIIRKLNKSESNNVIAIKRF